MQVFKTFIKIAMKRFHVSMIYILIFIVINVIMTASSNESTGFESSKLEVSVTDLDNSEASRALTEYIAENHELVEIENDSDAILDALYYQRAQIVLTINEGYSEKLSKGETDNLFSDYRVPGTYSAEFFDSQLNNYIGTVSAYIAGGLTAEEAHIKASELAQSEVKVELLSSSDDSGNSTDQGFNAYFQYLAYILIAVLLTGLCPTLLVMTSKEIRNRTNCSCMSVSKQMVQIAAGNAVFSAAIFLLLMLVAAIIFRSVIFTEKGLLSVLNGFAYLLFAMMLTLLMAIIAPSPKAVDMISNIFSLGMCFLCGVFVPQELLSDTVLNIGKFLPAYWYMKAVNMISGTNGEFYSAGGFMACIGIQLAFTAALFLVTLLIAKAKRSSKTV